MIKAYNKSYNERPHVKEKEKWYEANQERLKQLDIEFRKTVYKHYPNNNTTNAP